MSRRDATTRAVESVVAGTHGDPFSILGPHTSGRDGVIRIRAFLPHAESVSVIGFFDDTELAPMERIHDDGFFSADVAGDNPLAFAYRFKVTPRGGQPYVTDDPYRFGPRIGELDLYLLAEGTHLNSYERLGAHAVEHNDVEGVYFAVWAPNAKRVSVVGDFNEWDGRRHPMRNHPSAGVWEIFIPGLGDGTVYKYELIGPDGNLLPLKTDPYAFYCEQPPATASIVHKTPSRKWNDDAWMSRREAANDRSAPISIYEVHLGSWRRDENNQPLTYRELAEQLVPYVKDMGFTHIELMPVNEHPFDGSWGYQPVGLFAPTSRFGTPGDFAHFVEACHAEGIGLIIDWVPGHFPEDAHGLGWFDGTHLYEHADPRKGKHTDWGTLIYNYGRTEVRNYLISNAVFWMDRYHIDGLRVDAVASMLYLDYSREDGQWIPNEFGGNENLEAIDFMKKMNETVYAHHPGSMTAAEESTSWPMVSRPAYLGGLGFGYKWNMGWMNDTLRYISEDPVHRKYHHNELTFGLLYAFHENFILPLSHDEVVHGKGSILGRMPGDEWQRHANLRAYYTFMFTHPGKKLLFMGCEFAQGSEWNYQAALDWWVLDYTYHQGAQRLVRDLNRLYRDIPALHELDCESSGFAWIEANDNENSVLSFVRYGHDRSKCAVVVINFTPVVRTDYRVGVPQGGMWREVFNSDSAYYGGTDIGNGGAIEARDKPSHGYDHSVSLTVPPLGGLVLMPADD